MMVEREMTEMTQRLMRIRRDVVEQINEEIRELASRLPCPNGHEGCQNLRLEEGAGALLLLPACANCGWTLPVEVTA